MATITAAGPVGAVANSGPVDTVTAFLTSAGITALNGAGADALTLTVDADGFAGLDTLTFFDAGADSSTVIGNGFGHVIQLGAGNDTFFGGATAAAGGDGGDIVFDVSGDNTIYGGASRDYIKAGTGDDTIGGGGGGDIIRDQGGNNEIYAGVGDDSVLVNGSGANTVFLGAGNDVLVLRDTVSTSTVGGGAGDDDVTAGGGNDTIFGGAGNDTLRGGAGVDVIWGGAGEDLMTGGTGNDVFAFEAGNGAGIVLDFVAGADKIDLRAFALDAAAQTALVAGITEGRLVDATGALSLVDPTLDSWFSISDVSVIVEGVTGLAATDFLFA